MKIIRIKMPEPIRTTVIMKPDDLGKIRKHKADFLAQGYDLTMGQIIRLAIRELRAGGVSSSVLKGLLAEDGRRKAVAE
jgi:hypothetical protein